MPKCAADAATCSLINRFIDIIINPMLLLIGAVAVIVFIWGVIEYLLKLRKGEDAPDGKQHMLWGMIGLFIIVSAYTLLTFIANTVGGFLP